MYAALAESKQSQHPPVLLDVTIGFEDFSPGEVPSPYSCFCLGRSPPKVHMLIEAIDIGVPDDANQLCAQLFATKEKRLSQFYAQPGVLVAYPTWMHSWAAPQ